MHLIIKSSCKEFVWDGVWVTVHIHTHETLSVYFRGMCLVTFTDLPCRLYHPRKPSTTPFANLPILPPTIWAHCPSTCACKNTKPHSTIFTRFSTTMSYISSTALCMLICNIHYCRLAIQVSSTSIKPWPQILTCFAFILNYAILVYVVIMCHTVNPDVAHTAPVQSFSTFAPMHHNTVAMLHTVTLPHTL